MKNVLLLCLGLIVGCGSENKASNSSPINSGDTSAPPVAPSDDEIRNSMAWLRFPDESVGEWISGHDAAAIVQLSNIQFHSTEPLPSKGYVPLGCSGPTVSAELRNDSDHFLADVELIVTATEMQSGERLAEMSTGTMIPYRLTPPHSDDKREVLLGEILHPDSSPFAGADTWPAFTVTARILRIRLLDEPTLLAYHRKKEIEVMKYRAAHKGEHDP